MEHIGKFVLYLILAVNALFVGMLILSAYSPYLQPKIHPIASCLGLAFPIFLAVNICFTLFWVIISYRYALLPVIGFLVCIPQIRTYIPINSTVETIPDGSIKFLSYNVMGFNNLEKKEGKNPILSYLADSEADIICLQEYNSTKNKKYLTDEDIRKALKAYPYRSIHNPERGGSQLACFSKFPILSARPIKYESTYNGSMQYTLKVNEDTITLINNHLESNKLTKEDKVIYEDMIKDPNAKKVKTGLRQLIKKLAEASAIRSSQADSVAVAIANSKYPTIITCGDFNDASISYTHRILTQQLDDAFTQSGRGLGISYNLNKFYFRIDNILISPNQKAYNCTVDRSIKDPFTFARTNVMGTLSLLQAAKLYWESLPEGYAGKRFYHISTDEVYGALEMNHPEGIEPPFSTTASSTEHHLAYGDDFFYETTKYNPHSPYSAAKASSDHFVRAYHDTYGLPTIVTNCSNNYGPYQFPEKLIPLFINNIRHRKPLPVYGKGENVRDWLYVEDHARAIDLIFHQGKVAETYNIGGFNEWKNIDLIKVMIKTVDRILGNPKGHSLGLITYVADRLGHDTRYAIDSTKLQKELGWEPSLQFEEGIEKTVRWYLENQEWMDHVTSGDYQRYYENMYKAQ